MEILNTTNPISTSQIFPKVSFFSPKISFTTQRNTNHLKLNPKTSIYLPFSLNLPFSDSRRFRISAHFGRPTSRRNSLRKKLTEKTQVREIPPFQDSSSEKIQINLDNVVEIEDFVDSNALKKPNLEVNTFDSVLSTQLESWVDQYKLDSEFWGVGSRPIFTVFQNSNGKVERVDVNEDEILSRSGVEPTLYKASEVENVNEVNSKISRAKYLATEMANGNSMLSKNSSVVKFVGSSGELGFVNAIRGVAVSSGLFSKMSKVGIMALCGIFVIWVVKRLFDVDKDRTEYTRVEKEMLRRKMKARMEKDSLVKGSVEVIQAPKELEFASIERPLLDRQNLMDNIVKAKTSTESSVEAVKSTNFDDKIREIRAMARHARELEKKDQGQLGGNDAEDNQIVNELSNATKVIQQNGALNSQNGHPNGYIGKFKDVGETIVSIPVDDPRSNAANIHVKPLVENSVTINSSTAGICVSNASQNGELEDKCDGLNLSDTTETSKTYEPAKNSVKAKPRVIVSVKEARDYLSEKRDRQEPSKQFQSTTVHNDIILSESKFDGETSLGHADNGYVTDVSIFSTPDLLHTEFTSPEHTHQTHESTSPKSIEAAEELCEASDHHISRASSTPESIKERGTSNLRFPIERELDRQIEQELETDDFWRQTSDIHAKSESASSSQSASSIPTKANDAEYVDEGINHQTHVTSLDPASTDSTEVAAPPLTKDNWMENNFHEFEPVAKKIAVGFKDNYMVAREKKMNEELHHGSVMKLPKYDEDDGELDWMKDDRLREIVFQVRENELMGRDPFHLMDAEDKQAFFDGLEKKVEKVNENLQHLHQYIHSNIENLDYGADGISVNDPLEKIIPRWKGPPIGSNSTSPQSLDDYLEQRKALTESLRSQLVKNGDAEIPFQTSVESSQYENGVTTLAVNNQNKAGQVGPIKSPKIIIEGSDGSVRAGKKSGKEYWKHTKKWSRGFLESYNAETDPEIKATMKDIGKDLDRWITEKEIQESADLMDNLPQRGRKLIQEKLYKVRKEVEYYGPQAVVNKYSGYTEEKEEDYLWWLDLPFVLCIELYTNQDGDQNIGFYSLEMAADLELDPKQYHVIAFEDAGDCKNMAYIIQSHLEMLGNGNAMVVAQRPKDAFREAKSNGFSVTVIRKEQLKLNVDQTLEEVEEQITEIGSKMYHDKITKGRSVDITSLTKGVFGIKKPMKRKRSKRKSKKPTKN